MRKHHKVFLESRGITEFDPWCCELCGRPVANAIALDVHHIRRRGMGGNKNLDYPENLIGMCRFPCHYSADANLIKKEELSEQVRGVLAQIRRRK